MGKTCLSLGVVGVKRIYADPPTPAVGSVLEYDVTCMDIRRTSSLFQEARSERYVCRCNNGPAVRSNWSYPLGAKGALADLARLAIVGPFCDRSSYVRACSLPAGRARFRIVQWLEWLRLSLGDTCLAASLITLEGPTTDGMTCGSISSRRGDMLATVLYVQAGQYGLEFIFTSPARCT